MGWFGKAKVSTESEKKNENQYGTRTPIVGPQYTDTFNAFRSNIMPFAGPIPTPSQQQPLRPPGQVARSTLASMPSTMAAVVNRGSGATNTVETSGVDPNAGPGGVSYAQNGADPMLGANAIQRPAITSLNEIVTSGRPITAANTANARLGQLDTSYNKFATQRPHLLGKTPTAGVYTAANVDPIVAKTGASFMDAYKNPYENEVIAASLGQYDQDAAEARNFLRAGNAAAFANKRIGVSEGQFGADSALGRASLGAGLRSEGFNTRATLGMADADRTLQADTTSAANLLNNRQFNAGLKTENNQFNANMQNDRDKFNVESRYKNDAQAMDALAAQAGLTQQQAQNIFTADGINMEAAQSLLAAGSITQEQLSALLDAASAYNGYEWDQQTSSTRNANSKSFELGGTFSI